MLNIFKNLLFTVTFNFSLFLILIIGIQNSKIKNRANLIFSETVSLPLSFIVGVSFISGSVTGNLLKLTFKDK